ncbi:MAG: response regulator [Deltaproteobacteria bacterium]|nr:response regulator [Deltaproteobacteria bacterium]
MEQKLKILVVDDEEPIRMVMKEFLEHGSRYEVFTAHDGFQALQIIARERIDCCFTDISMPLMDGLELTGKIQALDNTIPVVVMTGYPSTDTAITTLKNGVVDFLVKPLKMDQIEAVIKRSIRERELFVENLLLKEELKGKEKIIRLNRDLNEKIKELKTVNIILQRLDRPAGGRELFETLVKLCGEVTSCDEAHLYLLNQNTEDPAAISSFYGQAGVASRESPFDQKEILTQIAKDGIPILMKGKDGRGTLIAAPLKIRSSIFGALVLNTMNGMKDLKERDLYYVDFLLEKASTSIENFALYENLHESLFSTLYAFVETLEARDAYTKQHSSRVTEYAETVARFMGCSDEELETLHVAGYLHDIGKIGIPDCILLKPGRLTEDEFEFIKKHPVIGSNIVGHFSMWAKEKEVIKHHHERWDGHGYPDGLCKEEIPYLARIVSIADSYDALTSDRSYRKKMTGVKALSIIRENAGGQFDPEITAAFLHLFGLAGTVQEKTPHTEGTFCGEVLTDSAQTRS